MDAKLSSLKNEEYGLETCSKKFSSKGQVSGVVQNLTHILVKMTKNASHTYFNSFNLTWQNLIKIDSLAWSI